MPITKDAECDIQEPFNSGQRVTALAKRGAYTSRFNFFWLDLLRSPTPGIPLSRQRVKALVLVGTLLARFRIASIFHSVGAAGEVVAGSAVAWVGSNMLSAPKMHLCLRTSDLAHHQRSPKPSLFTQEDAHLKIIHRRAIPAPRSRGSSLLLPLSVPTRSTSPKFKKTSMS